MSGLGTAAGTPPVSDRGLEDESRSLACD
jgi:hypothetical protein